MTNNATEILALPAFKDNYIWLLRAAGGAPGFAAVVDPGDAAPVLDHLARSGDRLCAILLTHHHQDHMGGVTELLAQHAGTCSTEAELPVFGPALENIEGVNQPLHGGEHIEVPQIKIEFDVLAVPGHTRGHLAYYGPSLQCGPDGSGAVFCGDTLFGAGCGRLFEGTAAQMQASLARLAVLPAPTFVYCAHEYTQSNLNFALAVEPDNAEVRQRVEQVSALRRQGQATVPTRIGVELATNPFLRWDAASVRQAAEHRLGRAPADRVETFAAIREWKNQF